MPGISITELLRLALSNLEIDDSERLLQKFLTYLNGEMFKTIADLRLAVDDKDAWSDLKLPVRLKLELKRLLLSDLNFSTNTTDAASSSSPAKWKRCFSQEYEAHYFLNLETHEAQWEEPEGEAYVESKDNIEESSGRGSSRPTSPGSRIYSQPVQTAANVDQFYSTMSLDYKSSPGDSPRSQSGGQTTVATATSSSPRMYIVHDAIAVVDTITAEDGGAVAHAEDKLDRRDMVRRLREMGFPEDAANLALEMNADNLANAAAYLVSDAKATSETVDASRCTTASVTSLSGKGPSLSSKLGLPRLILGTGASSKAKQTP
jgi:hypothetical protein